MSYIPQIEFFRKRPFGHKLNATFVFIRENSKPFFKAQLLVAGPILLLITIIINQFSFDFMNMGFGEQDFTASDVMRFIKLYGLLVVSGIITSAVMLAVIYGYMKKYQTIEPNMISNSDVTAGLGFKIFNLIGFNILITIIITTVVFILSFIIGVTATSSVFLVVIFGIIALCLVFYIFVTMGLGPAIIVFEDNNPIDAIDRCFKLIVGKWWSTFGLVVVMVILGAIINQLFGLPRAILFGIKAFTSFEEGVIFLRL